MSQPVELIPLLCTRCQAAIPAQPDEVAWVCAQCGQGLLLSEDKGAVPLTINYSAEIPPDGKGRPFWVVTGQAGMQRRIYGGGDQSQQAQDYWRSPHLFFVPAFNLPLDQMVDWGMRLLQQPPTLKAALPEARHPAFLPVTLMPDDIQPMVEFIVMGVEASRKDKIKEVQLSVKLDTPEFWILP
jgi:hypothetical protein